MVKKNYLIIIMIAFGLASYSSAGVKGFEFLRTHVGARPSALGGAFIAVPGDVHAIYYNPSALVTLNEKQLTFSYLNHFLDFQSGFVAYGFRMPGIGHFGIGTHYLNYGEFKRTDELGNENGTFGAGNLTVLADYAVKLAEDFSIGTAFKFINSSIAEYHSTALAFDFGLLYQFPAQDLQIGFGVFNAGTVTKAFIESKDELPLNYRIGASKKLAHLPLMLNLEGYQYIDENFHFIVGGEFTVTPFLFLRLSYNSVGRDQKIKQNGDKYAGVSIGTGVSFGQAERFRNTFWQKMALDYSFTSAGNVGNLNRLSFVIRL